MHSLRRKRRREIEWGFPRDGKSSRDVRRTGGAGFRVVARDWGLSRLTLLTDDSRAGHVVRVLERRHLSVGVALPMGTLPPPRFVERPVLVEIATGTKHLEAQHRLSSAQPPARAGEASRWLTKCRQGAFDTPEPIGSPAASYWS